MEHDKWKLAHCTNVSTLFNDSIFRYIVNYIINFSRRKMVFFSHICVSVAHTTHNLSLFTNMPVITARQATLWYWFTCRNKNYIPLQARTLCISTFTFYSNALQTTQFQSHSRISRAAVRTEHLWFLLVQPKWHFSIHIKFFYHDKVSNISYGN